ncbi:hypothetical protein E2C01_062885 [Portunus trituberculatus]|uniref:Uncharacterized protein n=1 Tax=Portunus trituberculatus TaxID=210409 RepID=A0A5B7H7Q6_PORTR|nr:hypothetical protein [Portunus trituberculatus]
MIGAPRLAVPRLSSRHCRTLAKTSMPGLSSHISDVSATRSGRIHEPPGCVNIPLNSSFPYPYLAKRSTPRDLQDEGGAAQGYTRKSYCRDKKQNANFCHSTSIRK